MAKIEICFDGNGKFATVDFDRLPELLEQEHAFVWIDADANSTEEMESLQVQFGLHKLAVDNAMTMKQRAQINLFDDMIFLEFYGLRFEGSDGDIVADDIAIFVGEKFVITARRHEQPSLAGVQKRWRDEQARENNHTHGASNAISPVRRQKQPTSGMFLYAILDDLVDGYFPIVDVLGDQIEELEDTVIASESHEPQRDIQQMRSRLLRLRRLLSPEQEVLNSLLRRDIPVIEEAIIPYFADVHDHVLRIHDWMESYRDQLSTIVDLQLSMQSNRLDRTVRTLTVWSIVLMMSTLVAGIYGMNFVHMPELDWKLGYPFSLGMMALLGGGLYLMFHRRGWL